MEAAQCGYSPPSPSLSLRRQATSSAVRVGVRAATATGAPRETEELGKGVGEKVEGNEVEKD